MLEKTRKKYRKIFVYSNFI